MVTELGMPANKNGTENEILNAIAEYLWYNRIFFYRNNNTSIYDAKRKAYRKMPKWSIAGVSDIVAVLPNGQACYIEVKKEGSYLSQAQKDFIEAVKENGGIAFVARSVEDVREKLIHLTQTD